jgi:hypothetical protein
MTETTEESKSIGSLLQPKPGASLGDFIQSFLTVQGTRLPFNCGSIEKERRLSLTSLGLFDVVERTGSNHVTGETTSIASGRAGKFNSRLYCEYDWPPMDLGSGNNV